MKEYKTNITLDFEIGEKLKLISKKEVRSIQGTLKKIVSDYVKEYKIK